MTYVYFPPKICTKVTSTLEPRFNEPTYNEVLGKKKRFSSARPKLQQVYETLSQFNEPRFNEILVITNTIHKRKRKIYLNITNKYQQAIKDECQTDLRG